MKLLKRNNKIFKILLIKTFKLNNKNKYKYKKYKIVNYNLIKLIK